MICSNNMAAKAREVNETLDQVCKVDSPYRASMDSLLARGAFRHADDVAYASIMLERGAESVDEIEAYLHKTYRDDIKHRCDPVYPS